MTNHLTPISRAALVASLLAAANPATAQVPTTLTLQGVLRDASGVPVDADHDVRLRARERLDRAVGREPRPLAPDVGLFTVELGLVHAPMTADLFADGRRTSWR